MPVSATVEFAQALIRQKSVTPDDADCQHLISSRLSKIGFSCEQINFHDVSNLWAVRGRQKPLLAFAGHTDVVPTGPLHQWSIPPFNGEIANDMLHGRGAADMKGSIASFVTACERFIERYPDHQGAISLLITSDEEGIAKWGTEAVINELNARDVSIDMCIVGEPTCSKVFGDTVKVGRRGSMNGRLTVLGKQGHIAYPHLAENPLHAALPALTELVSRKWDQGNENFQPTAFQLSNIHGGTGATNVIPGEVHIDINFRYSPETNDVELKQSVEAILTRHNLQFEIEWGAPGYPYETRQGLLVNAVTESIVEITGVTPELSTSGGTSDGRFIAPTGTQVVELGPLNATIHQINEQVSTADLDLLSRCYERILVRLLAANSC
jgi:succinyl-diaminopimelate desuccinylase